MGVQSKPSWMLTPALKGRLIRDSCLKLKDVTHRPGIIKILDQTEALIPETFEIIDESVSGGYLRLLRRDSEDSFIILLFSVAFAICLSCAQAFLKSLFVLVELGKQQESATQDGEPCRLSISEHINAVIRILTNRLHAVIQLLTDIANEIHRILDRNDDGRIGMGDLMQLSVIAVRYLGKFIMFLASTIWFYVLIIIRNFVDVCMPPTPAPMKPDALFHQNSPKTIAEEKLEKFERTQPEPITISAIAKLVYKRLASRGGPRFQRAVSWIEVVCGWLWRACQWIQCTARRALCRCGVSCKNQTPDCPANV